MTSIVSKQISIKLDTIVIFPNERLNSIDCFNSNFYPMYTGHLIFLFSNSLDFLVLLCLSQSPNNKSINKQTKSEEKDSQPFLFSTVSFFGGLVCQEIYRKIQILMNIQACTFYKHWQMQEQFFHILCCNKIFIESLREIKKIK